MQISERLKAVAALVTSGGTIADIGTDHAYIPIYLIKTGKAAHAIAMDVNRGPLARAREHIAQYGLNDMIETRLSDGLAALSPGEADSVVIAGMGGSLMVRILEMGRDVLVGLQGSADGFLDVAPGFQGAEDRSREESSGCREGSSGCRELVLQPQSEIWLVRTWLVRNGWQIVREDMVCEEGKYYPMMCAERRSEKLQDGLTDMELRFGPLLLREHHPVLREFLLRECELDRRILASLEGQTGEAAVARARQVREEMRLTERALGRYGETA